MKLFNINLNINSMKNILKLLLLAFIVILCIYILYISSFSTIEAFTESKDCSNCQIMPSSGNCIKLYDLSSANLNIYNSSDDIKIYLSNNKKLPDLSFIDTSYVFCPYEPKCLSNNYIDNIMTQDERQELNNEDFDRGFGGYNITCCSGEWLDGQISNFQSNKIVSNLNEKCNKLNNDINQYMDSINDIDILDIVPDSYFSVKSMCNNYKNNDICGMLFLTSISGGHILQDPKLVPKTNDPNDRIESVQELLDAQRMLSISMEQVDVTDDQGNVIRTETTISGETLSKINDLNRNLKKLNPADNNFNAKFIRIQEDLAELYKDSDGDHILEYTDYKYIPYKQNVVGNGLQEITPPLNANVSSYLLNEDEFLNCFGDVTNTQILRFASGEYADMKSTTGRNNFFGVKEDAEYKTQQDAQGNKYSDIIDLSAEFRHLQNVKMGENVSTGVIDQYLRAINGFYEKQMANMLGPRTQAVNQQLVFENDSLQTKESTFFVYDNEVNNEYECQPSITGNDKFKTCGPAAYYSEFKP